MSYTETVNVPIPPPHIPRIAINIDHKSDNCHDLEAAIEAANMAVWGGNPKPTPQETHDEYGTPLGAFELPDTFDLKEGVNMDRRYVTAMSMLAMRMKWGPFNTSEIDRFNPLTPFDHVSIHRGTEQVCVFVVVSGEPMVFADDVNLFPSDELVGKIRLLEAANKAKQE